MAPAANHWPGPTAAKGAAPATTPEPITDAAMVEVAVEGLTPWRLRWDEFGRDNAGTDLDLAAVAAALAKGETWSGGGGASPPWSVKVVP